MQKHRTHNSYLIPHHWSRRSEGFTLMELLTVVAIAAILAAVMFPTFKSAKENAKKTSCISHLHTIGTALQQYRLDNHRYPVCLLGYYQNGQPMTSCKSGLYPEYVRSIDDFTCPSMGSQGQPDDGITAPLPASAGGGTCEYYFGDSYGWTDNTGFGNPTVTYLKRWAITQDQVTDYTLCDPPDDSDRSKELRDFGRQLRFKTPGADTVVTWCSNHRHSSDVTVVLFLDGSVVPTALAKMDPTIGDPEGNMLWRVLPR